ncbi:MAG: HAD hydrolase-like protein [Candidatus Omnitrophica bacterium]|nr:HAD hydrolase-like protein [Candidatus Omnitrophota bacterium]
MIKAVFFDFDGVIVESVDIKTAAFAKVFKGEGDEVVQKVIDYHVRNTGVSRYDKFKYIYKEILSRPLTDAKFGELCDNFAAIVLDEVIKAPYVKGALEFLKDSVKQYKYFIVSATPQDEIEGIVRARGISGFFEKAYGAPTKKADAVREALDSYKIKPREAAYIGDAMSDYAAAKENSVNFIARLSGGENVFEGISCIKIKDLSVLDGIVKGL